MLSNPPLSSLRELSTCVSLAPTQLIMLSTPPALPFTLRVAYIYFISHRLFLIYKLNSSQLLILSTPPFSLQELPTCVSLALPQLLMLSTASPPFHFQELPTCSPFSLLLMLSTPPTPPPPFTFRVAYLCLHSSLHIMFYVFLIETSFP